jgi:hypothetical protein
LRAEYPFCPDGESKEALVDRTKRRIALCLAASALASAFMVAPAAADDSCYPYPEVYCNTMSWVIECVWWGIEYGEVHDRCDS